MTSSLIRKLAHLVPLAGLPVISSCVVPDDTSSFAKEEPVVAAARRELVNLDEADVRMCAGFPNRAADVGTSGKIWTYERAVPRSSLNVFVPTGSANVLPGVGGSVNLAPGGYCNTQIQFNDGRVVKVAYAGDNNLAGSLNALCASIVDGCVAYARELRGPDGGH